MKKVAVYTWLFVYFLLVLYVDMKKFFNKNIELIMVLIWFTTIFFVSKFFV